MATADAKPDPLRRLGGGRWETKDGRFQIEPQSGTWVIVDTTQTNEFGLPLVRGPFPSLTAAREAIDAARGEGPATSPLADRIEHVRSAPKDSGSSRPAKEAADKRSRRAAATPTPEPPPDPAWLRALQAGARRRAKTIIQRLEALGVPDADVIARAEVVDDLPAVTRLALERRLRDAIGSTRDPRTAAAAAIEVVIGGSDDDLEVEWRLTDGRGRPIEGIDLGE